MESSQILMTVYVVTDLGAGGRVKMGVEEEAEVGE